MIGKYKIYKNKKLVVASNNLITNFGKIYLPGAMANQFPTIGDSIAVGTSTTAANVADVALGFEFCRGEINLRSVLSGTPPTLVLKAELDDNVGGNINEIGLFPIFGNSMSGIYTTKVLAQFDPLLETWSGGNTNTTKFNIGTSSLEYVVTTGTTVAYIFTPFNENLDGYSIVDRFSLGYFINDVRASAITLQFQTDSSNYFQYTFAPSTVTGYHIQNWTKPSMTTVGTPDWENITVLSASVTATGGTSTVQLDGLVITDMDIYQDYGLISHSILPSVVSKAPDEAIEVEYYIGLSM